MTCLGKCQVRDVTYCERVATTASGITCHSTARHCGWPGGRKASRAGMDVPALQRTGHGWFSPARVQGHTSRPASPDPVEELKQKVSELRKAPDAFCVEDDRAVDESRLRCDPMSLDFPAAKASDRIDPARSRSWDVEYRAHRTWRDERDQYWCGDICLPQLGGFCGSQCQEQGGG